MNSHSSSEFTNEREIPDNFETDLGTGEESTNNAKVRKRIDDLLEKKRLKELLDDEDDWDI